MYVALGYYDLYDESSDATVIVHGTWHVNPNYGFTPFYANNIALIKLDTSVTLSDRIHTINMPKKDSEPAIGTSILVSGWGITAGKLMFKKKHFASLAFCQVLRNFSLV